MFILANVHCKLITRRQIVFLRFLMKTFAWLRQQQMWPN